VRRTRLCSWRTPRLEHELNTSLNRNGQLPSDNPGKSMSNLSAIRIVRPSEFDNSTLQTPGSQRQAAIAPQLGIESTMWGGVFEVSPGARTGIHHHGEQQTIAYVLSGVCEVRWGANGEFAASAEAGDFIHVPAFLPHMEINRSDSQRSDGSWCEARRHRSWSIFRMTRGVSSSNGRERSHATNLSGPE